MKDTKIIGNPSHKQSMYAISRCLCLPYFTIKMNHMLVNIPYPMYEIFAYIWLKVMVNVGKQSIHGAFGYNGVSGSGSFSHRGKPLYCDQTPFVS